MARSPSCFNLYWGWLLIFLGSHESQVADPMIEAQWSTTKPDGMWSFRAVVPAVSYQPTGARRSARDHSTVMPDRGGWSLPRTRQMEPKGLMWESAPRAVTGVAGFFKTPTLDKTMSDRKHL